MNVKKFDSVKSVNEANQFMKNHGDIYYRHGAGFLAQDEGFQVWMTLQSFYAETNYIVKNPDELYKFIKDNKPNELFVDEENHSFYDNEGNVFKDIKLYNYHTDEDLNFTKNLERKFPIYNFFENSENSEKRKESIIVDASFSMSYNNEEVSNEINVNLLVDLVKKDVSNDSDHTLVFMEIHENEKTINIVNEIGDLDTSGKFIILPKHLFKKVKMLKRHTPIFNIYHDVEKSDIYIEYGNEDMCCCFMFNALMELDEN